MYSFTSKLLTYNIAATDGEMGKVKDLYMEDKTWHIRYAIVDTRRWLAERKVLLPPSSFSRINEEEEVLEVEYDKEMIKKSPPVPEESDLTHDKENQLIKYFGWSRDFNEKPLISGEHRVIGVFKTDNEMTREPVDYEREQLIENHRDNNLRSHEEIIGARVHGSNGKLGKVVDFIYDENWIIKYMVTQSAALLKDGYSYCSVNEIASIDWFEGDVYLDITVEAYQDGVAFKNKKDILHSLSQNELL
ncbi:PRC-barrel domain-containing protein [Oceanobacillus sp. CAU 1775]